MIRQPRRSLAAALGLFAMFASPSVALPQGLSLMGEGNQPLEIDAEQGIEWHRNDKVYVARGNARAARGEIAVHAEVLKAHYRAGNSGKTEIWRIEAEGAVRLTSPTQTVYGDRGVYDVDNAVAVLVGNDLKLVTQNEVITARDSLEYWERKQMAVARGDAQAKREDNQLRADVLTAHFLPGKNEKLKLERIDAYDNVEVSTPTEFARADRGVYYVEQELATLSGSVKVTRGDNQLNGQYAEVNLATGVSRLLASPPGEDGSDRVKGLLVPEKVSEPESGS